MQQLTGIVLQFFSEHNYLTATMHIPAQRLASMMPNAKFHLRVRRPEELNTERMGEIQQANRNDHGRQSSICIIVLLTLPLQKRPSKTSGAEYSRVPGVKPLLLLRMPACTHTLNCL